MCNKYASSEVCSFCILWGKEVWNLQIVFIINNKLPLSFNTTNANYSRLGSVEVQ